MLLLQPILSTLFISFSSLQLYIRKAKGKTKTVDVQNGRTSRLKESTNSRPPLSGEGRIEGKRATKVPFISSAIHSRLCIRESSLPLFSLSVSWSSAPSFCLFRSETRGVAHASYRSQQKGKISYRPIHLPWSQIRSLQRHLSCPVFILDLRHESKLYRDTARLLSVAIEKALLLFKNIIINKT